MNWKELLTRARDLYHKAAECEDAEERKDLLAKAEDLKERAEAAKAVSGFDAELGAEEPEDNGPDIKGLRDLMADQGYTDEQIKSVIGNLAEGDGGPVTGNETKQVSLREYLVASSRHDVKALKAMGARKDLLEGSGDTGGYLVPDQVLNQLWEAPGIMPKFRNNGAMVLQMARRSIRIPSLDQTGVPTSDVNLNLEGGVHFKWTGEGSTKTENEPSFKQIQLVANKLAGYTQASDELLADSAVGLEPLLRRLFGRAVRRIEDYYFFNGNGVGQPLGVLNAGALTAVARDTANQVAYADIADMWAELPPWSYGSAVWFVSQAALPEFLTMEDGAGNNVFMPQESGGARQDVMGTIFGRPLVVTTHQPALGTQGDVLLCDLSYYVIGDRQAVTIQSSSDYAFVDDLTTWRVVHRFDGQPWISDVIYTSSTETVSPFVALAA